MQRLIEAADEEKVVRAFPFAAIFTLTLAAQLHQSALEALQARVAAADKEKANLEEQVRLQRLRACC